MAQKTTFSVDASGPWTEHGGGRGWMLVYGTFGSGSMDLEYTFDGTTAISSASTVTANGGGTFELPPCQVRATLSGSSGPALTTVIY